MTRRPVTWLASLLLLGVSTGCGVDFEPASKLEKLRILAIRLTPPEARPLETVTAEALVWVPANEAGDRPTPEYAWRACLLTANLLGGGLGASAAETTESSCFDLPHTLTLDEVLELAASGESDPLAGISLGDTAIDLGHAPTATLLASPLPRFDAPASFCPALPEEERIDRGGRELWLAGLRLTVSLRVGLPDGATATANKRLLIRPDPATIPAAEQGRPFRSPRLCDADSPTPDPCGRNDNPEPPALLTPNGEWSGEGPIPVRRGERIKLRPVPPEAEHQQPYLIIKSCGEQVTVPGLQATGGEVARLESRYWSWLADGGGIVADTTSLAADLGDRDSAWDAPTDLAAGDRFTLVVLAWDGRGGVSWQQFPLQVLP